MTLSVLLAASWSFSPLQLKVTAETISGHCEPKKNKINKIKILFFTCGEGVVLIARVFIVLGLTHMKTVALYRMDR